MDFCKLGIMFDCSRNAVMNISTVKNWIDITSDLGYNTFMLYTEETYEVENQPYFGYLRGRYSREELMEIDDYAARHNMEVIPTIQTLGHLENIFHWKAYGDIRDCEGILLADDEKTYRLIEDIFSTLSKTFKSRTVNIGMDEAYSLGRGKHKDIYGDEKSTDILLRHLNKVAEIADKYGFKCIMWADMFLKMSLSGDVEAVADVEEVDAKIKDLIPQNVELVYWDYGIDKKFMLGRMKVLSSISDNFWFAGGLWSWCGFAPHNAYSLPAVDAGFANCREMGVKNVFVTLWGDYGAETSKYAMLPSVYYASMVAKGVTDLEVIKGGFAKKFGIPFDDFMEADLKGTPGYSENRIYNPDKYMLFNDLFLGALDLNVAEGDAITYANCVDRLKKLESDSRYGYVFETLRRLSEVLAVKSELGIKTRKAYGEKNRNELEKLLKDYKKLDTLINDFYIAFKNQWERENKPQGFEVQDIRIGGLMLRVRHLSERLEAYLKEEISSLPELEEEILDYNGAPQPTRTPVLVKNWQQIATASPLL